MPPNTALQQTRRLFSLVALRGRFGATPFVRGLASAAGAAQLSAWSLGGMRRSSGVALCLIALLVAGCGLNTTPLPLPSAERVCAVRVLWYDSDARSHNREVAEPSEAQAICALLRSLNSHWLPRHGPDANSQLSVYVRAEQGWIAFWIGPDWMSASLPGDLVLAKRYRRLSSEERAALEALLVPH